MFTSISRANLFLGVGVETIDYGEDFARVSPVEVIAGHAGGRSHEAVKLLVETLATRWVQNRSGLTVRV